MLVFRFNIDFFSYHCCSAFMSPCILTLERYLHENKCMRTSWRLCLSCSLYSTRPCKNNRAGSIGQPLDSYERGRLAYHLRFLQQPCQPVCENPFSFSVPRLAFRRNMTCGHDRHPSLSSEQLPCSVLTVVTGPFHICYNLTQETFQATSTALKHFCCF